jgi:hypothetical protein
MATEFPVVLPLKFNPRSVVAGHPKQLNDLLCNGVATAIVKCKKDSSFYECLLRCPTLAPDVNLPVYISLEHFNQPLSIDEKGASLELVRDGKVPRGVQDEARAKEWSEALDLALSFWQVKMEEAVLALYPDRNPKEVDRFSSAGILELPTNKNQNVDVAKLLDQCNSRRGFPTMKLAYGYIGSKEDPRSREHIWGLKFELGQFGNLPTLPRQRVKGITAAEKQEQLIKKRKTDEVVEEESK